MAKFLHHGVIMVADDTTGAIFPWLQRTIAKLVLFPDGRSLWDHWQEEIMGYNRAKFRMEQTKEGDNTFNWETNVFGKTNAVLKCHTVIAMPMQSGNKYIYRITLPREYIPEGRSVNYDNAAFYVTERENSTFMRRQCVHNVYVNVESNSQLQVIVEHLKSIDKVNLANEPFITAGFDITCNLAFNQYL